MVTYPTPRRTRTSTRRSYLTRRGTVVGETPGIPSERRRDESDSDASGKVEGPEQK